MVSDLGWPTRTTPKLHGGNTSCHKMKSFGPGGEGYDLTDEQKTKSYEFQIQIHVLGYGYSWKGSSAAKVSLIILLIQLAIAASFIVWTIATGTSSITWDSPTELIALALASDVPADRKRLATGEAPIELLKKRYCVVTECKRLQLKEFTGKVPEGDRV